MIKMHGSLMSRRWNTY